MNIRSFLLLAGLCFASFASAQDFWIPLAGPTDLSILPSPQPLYGQYSKMLFAYTGDSIYRSSDNGNSWTKISDQLLGVIRVVETPSKKLFACGMQNKVLASTDGGFNWEVVPQLTGQFVSYLFVSPKGHIFATIMQGGVWRSTDDGVTWEAKNTGLPAEHWGQGIAFLSNGDMMMSTGLAGEYGIFRSSNDGNSWTRSDSGLKHTFTWWLCEAKPGLVLAGSMLKGVYRSTDNGRNWHSSSTGISDSTESEVFHIFADGDGTLYADCSYDAGLYRSTDEGLTWHSIQSGLKYKSPGLLAIDDDGYMYYGGRDRVYRAADKVTPPKAEVVEIVLPVINMYPNPAQEYIFVQTEDKDILTIYDQLGRVLGILNAEGCQTRVSTLHLVCGSYTIQIDGKAPLRFIKK